MDYPVRGMAAAAIDICGGVDPIKAVNRSLTERQRQWLQQQD
jgi:hypothetical protein